MVDGEVKTGPCVDVDLQSPLWRSGRSLFETMLVRREGVFGLSFLDDHIARLLRSAESLGWRGAPAPERLRGWVQEAALRFRERSPSWGRLRLTVAWTIGGSAPSTAVAVVPYKPPAAPARAWVTRVQLSWGLPFPMPKAGNRLLYDLAEEEARRFGADEGILVDREGALLEGARSNLFLVRDGAVVTAPLTSGVLPGIARARVIEAAKGLGLLVREAAVECGAPREGDELFLTNALWGVRPVATLGGRPAPIGPVTRALKDAYDRAVQSRIE